MMHSRNRYTTSEQEPRAIAIAATKSANLITLSWQISLGLLAYSWLSLILK